MASIQTIFADTSVSSPLENLVYQQTKHTKDIFVDRANRGLVVGVTVGKVVIGIVAFHAGYNNNPIELADAGIAETVFGYWLVPLAAKARDVVRDHMKAAAATVTAPIKTQVNKLRPAIPHTPYNRMLEAPHARRTLKH